MAGATPPRLRELVVRAWRTRCPACGVGPIFEAGSTRGAVRCEACGWKLLRDDGHWLGGIEINMLFSLLLGTSLTITLGVFLGFTFWTAFTGGMLTLLFSSWFYGRSRALFYALDYYLDPQPDDSDGGSDDDDGGWHAPLPDEPFFPTEGLGIDLPLEQVAPSRSRRRRRDKVPVG